ncbi:non-ribosomal peptide synthetase [Amycolatopsis sp. 195334CR]|uniref:non-ribosomal peptide synthetase n=1 Tax=Amycolatopsis sp. 195334CR TaxID=2814588 RepID=UPI001A8E8EC1|nr:non-ribosomal peptide synthetase [Amycolatopsis sp. 195334CR]MBN6036993.1 non-ribosomal peptide synthetase [Amycolatopsis sp. 195334CR]
MAFEAIQALVAKAIGRFPDHVAVECADGKLTYAELDRRADDIAAALQEAGAAPGALVPVLAEDRRELVAAVLGVLRIGGVVVPLDATAQQRRLEQALNDTDASWVVTGSDLGGLPAKVLAAAGATETTRIDIADTAGTSARRAVVAHEPRPDDPCYLFFTSGSTGRPKGIVGRLGSVDHYIRWETELLGVDAGWRVSQLISPAFDAVLRDIFVPLTTGATICVPPADTLLDAAALSRWLEAAEISLVHCVPSVFRRFATAPGDHRFAALECVALSGEKLAPRDAAGWFDRFGERTKLLNLYGPSETTMTKTFHFVTRADTERDSIPIGRAMPETEVLVLTDRGEPAAPGEVGEIHLRTAHRSLGYHRQPEATAKAFVPRDGELVYRTGDFGRFSTDGVLEYLGRKDHQVKIGGVRVELGGVESILREHPAVTEAAVVAGESADGIPFLCAHYEQNTNVDPAVLRAFLRERLPEAAVPAVFAPTTELPRTISGKIDRRALPATAPSTPDTPADVLEARTPTEQAIARIWASVLPGQSGAVDIRQDFFDAGGSSLLVIELLSRLGAEFGVSVPLHDFLSAPTVAAVAGLIEGSLIADDTDDLGL